MSPYSAVFMLNLSETDIIVNISNFTNSVLYLSNSVCIMF